MSRPLRIEYDGAWYHVMNRGQSRRRIVKTDSNRKLFLDILGETVQTYGIEVHGFSFMDNHYHLLIHTPVAGLSRAMRHLNGVYTKKINKEWKTDGPLFRGRYKAKVVDSENYLLELIRYIHHNPVSARICAKSQDHRWTSQVYYMQKLKRPAWLSTQKVLKRFGCSEKQAIKHMERFVHDGVPVWFSQEIQSNRVVLGVEGFREWVYQNHVDKDQDDITLKEKTPRPKVPVKQILEHVAYAYDVPITEIRQSRQGQLNEARSMAIYLARQLTGMRQRDLLKWFKGVNRYAIAKTIQRFKENLGNDRSLKKMTQDLENRIYMNS